MERRGDSSGAKSLMRIRDLRISVRLFGLTSFLLLVSIVCGTTAWLSLQRSQDRLDNLTSALLDVTRAADTARLAQVEFKTQIEEWKNLLIRSSSFERLEELRSVFQKQGIQTQKRLDELDVLLTRLRLETPLVGQAKAGLVQMEKDYLNAMSAYLVGDPDSIHIVDRMVVGIARGHMQSFDKIVAHVTTEAARITHERVAQAERQHHVALAWLAGLVVSGVLLGLLLTFWIVGGIIKPLRQAVEFARVVASGDLTKRIKAESRDETGQLIEALSSMSDGLHAIVSRVRESSESIQTGTREIAAGNLDLSARTEEQAASLEETAASMEELTSTVQHNLANVQTATNLALETSQLAGRGGEMALLVEKTMGQISESSRSINEIIGVIDSIAFQTNILALNAAVEAARAGEQGRGFAVVASEVRNLAQRSASAAKDIKVLIQTTVQRIDQGSELVTSTSVAINDIVRDISQVGSVMGEIRSATMEQSTGIGQVNDAVSQMDSATQQNAALVEEAAAAAASLEGQVVALVEVVSAFRLSDAFETGRHQSAPAQGKILHLATS